MFVVIFYLKLGYQVIMSNYLHPFSEITIKVKLSTLWIKYVDSKTRLNMSSDKANVKFLGNLCAHVASFIITTSYKVLIFKKVYT